MGPVSAAEAVATAELRVTPPMGAEQPAGALTCTYGTDPHLCGEPATWHLIWTPDNENGFACDRHREEARTRWTAYDEHPAEGVCNMPGTFVVWSWDVPPGKCVWKIEDEALAAAANAVEPVMTDA